MDPLEGYALARKGDDDRDDEERDGDDGDDDDRHDDDQGDGKPEADVDDPAIERSLVAFEKLFELMLKPGAGGAARGSWLFISGITSAERLQPDAAQATRWIEKLIPALLKAGVPTERRSDVAAAVLALLTASPTPAKLRWARGLFCFVWRLIPPCSASRNGTPAGVSIRIATDEDAG